MIIVYGLSTQGGKNVSPNREPAETTITPQQHYNLWFYNSVSIPVNHSRAVDKKKRQHEYTTQQTLDQVIFAIKDSKHQREADCFTTKATNFII